MLIKTIVYTLSNWQNVGFQRLKNLFLETPLTELGLHVWLTREQMARNVANTKTLSPANRLISYKRPFRIFYKLSKLVYRVMGLLWYSYTYTFIYFVLILLLPTLISTFPPYSLWLVPFPPIKWSAPLSVFVSHAFHNLFYQSPSFKISSSHLMVPASSWPTYTCIYECVCIYIYTHS